jgi:hydrogenase-4 component B
MFGIITAQISFLVLLTLFFAGSFGSLFLSKSYKLSALWSSFFSIVGSFWGIAFSISILMSEQSFLYLFQKLPFPLLEVSLKVDMLSAFFIFVISLISLFCSIYSIGYTKHFFEKYSNGILGFFYNLLIFSLLLVVTASNGIFFLIVWEIMSIASYFLVVYDRYDEGNVKAGSIYLTMTYVGTAFIIFSFLLLYKYTNSFDFSVIQSNAWAIPWYIKNTIFVSTLIGFGIKAGIIPFHIWLPEAHPAAPSHVSALMSGVMIKTGVYMMIRLFLDMLQPIPVWWGVTILLIGSVSALLGVLYAITEHDIKRLLAYHSIENIGIILLGLGSALIFTSLEMDTLALLAFVASLFHTLNHAIFKSLLFLSAGSVINETHTRNIEEYGGLIRYMPQTALFFLLGSMAISALPPFNGFFSEWLTFQTLFQGIIQLSSSLQWVFILATGSLAFTSGLALACFVKAFGATFLARPRSEEVKHAKESAFSMQIGMGGLALLSILFGVFSGYTSTLLQKVGSSLHIFHRTSSFISVSSYQKISVGDGFTSASALLLFAFLVLIVLLTMFVIRKVLYPTQQTTTDITWDCGTCLTPSMEITATGFTRSIILIFSGILKPSIQQKIEYNDEESRYMSKSRTVVLHITDVYNTYLYQPVCTMLDKVSCTIMNIQNGNINAYISYIFIALIISLLSIL